jgi:hypothetical protein
MAMQIAQSTWPSIFGNRALGSFGAFLGGSVIPLQAASHLGLGVAVLFVNTTIGALALLLPFWVSGSAAEGLEVDMLDGDDARETEGVVAVGESTQRWRLADVPRFGCCAHLSTLNLWARRRDAALVRYPIITNLHLTLRQLGRIT